ncbi:MAG: pilus assembly protein PilM [Elusimicrobia bacterium]|nr:pilus assembly protein PilM [Elusimicrobiota bacterium]
MKKSAAARFLIAQTQILGVDLGSSTIKVLQVRASRNRMFVRNFAQRHIRQLLEEAMTDADRHEVYVKTLTEMIHTGGFDAKGCAVALLGNQALVKFAKLPRTYKLDARRDIPDEAKSLSPFEPDQTEMDAQVMDGDNGSLEMKLLMADKRSVDDATDILKRAGLRPELIINESIAVEQAYEYLHGRSEESIVIVNIGASTTSTNIVENGVSRAVRVFNIAGDAFTRAIERDFGVSTVEAETFKEEYGLSGYRLSSPTRTGAETGNEAAVQIYNETAVRMYGVLKGPVKDLALEIRRTIDAYQSKRINTRVNIAKIVLAGGSADMKCLPEIVGAEIGLPIEVFRPLENARMRHADIAIAKVSSALAVVTGLALANAAQGSDPKLRLNLLGKKAQRAAAVKRLTPGIPVILTLILAAAAFAVYKVHKKLVAEEELQATMVATTTRKAHKKPFVPPKPQAPRVIPSPFAFLKRTMISGVLGTERDAIVMLSIGGKSYTARAGKLFDENDEEVQGVASRVAGGKLVMTTARRETFEFPLP